jgi:regulator of sirC expression with transglutaminase-like and TPR domain
MKTAHVIRWLLGADIEKGRVAIHATGAYADSDGDERGTRVSMKEACTQDTEPDLMIQQGTQRSMDDRWHALISECKAQERQWAMAECQELERRWAVVHKEALHLDQEWQHLLRMITNRMEAQPNGQSPGWTDGALLFYHLDKHAAHTSSLVHEAQQMCHQYALALQQVLEAMAEH